MVSESRKNILITGGAGFIGTHLARRLAGKGHRVEVLDLRSPSPIAGVLGVRGDVRDQVTVNELVGRADTVFHLAALVSVPLCDSAPEESHTTNFLGTSHVAEAARVASAHRREPVRIVFASSAAIYGHLGRAGVPLDETSPVPTPLSLYAAQKLFSEQLLALYHERHGLPVVSFRFFNVYGPGQDSASPYSGVISHFAAAVAAGRSLQLHGGGEQTRDFVHVDDIVRALELQIRQPVEAWDARPVNLGSGRSTSINALAKLLMQAAGNTVPLQSIAARAGDVRHSLAGIGVARERLRWTPQVGLSEGLSALIRSIRLPQAA